MAMEVATPAPAPLTAPERNIIVAPSAKATTTVETHKKNRIQVSNTKKPLFFYVNLAKELRKKKCFRLIQEIVFTFCSEVLTSTVGVKDESKGRMVHKAKIEIVLGKSEKFDSLVPPVTNGKTPEEAAKAETDAAVEAQEAAAT
ncbi:uncharacterized protein At2g34160 isoform X2 [Raphanus sativus]|uniref:Uncharacterized protein At2g34160 isoform X2 n=1 Tax=Raphanus sativus TaxID=3726 RepID=A0A6J0NZX4_RAPSA|nr:uncharacterized protein At2g34160 isoform X2 [Raphanus sativus]